MDKPITDFDTAYDNSAAVPGSADIAASLPERASAFRTRVAPETVPYGAHPRMQLDLFRPVGASKGLVVFFHGGYWRMRHRTDWSHLAEGPLAQGWTVALPSYPLCPEVRITDITRCALAATACAAERASGPVLISGHSAGGHLASRMVCADTALPTEVAVRIKGVLGISGVYDLRPLRRTAMNETLRIDAAEASAESPVLAEPRAGARFIAWVGAAELPEFVRQNAAIANLWHGLGAHTQLVEAPGRHHFDVVDPLTDPQSDLTQALVGLAASA